MCGTAYRNRTCRCGLSYQVYGMGDAVLRMGACGAGLGILVWLFHLTTDENYCMQMAKNYMVDYLENVCLHKYEKANQKERTGRRDSAIKKDETNDTKEEKGRKRGQNGARRKKNLFRYPAPVLCRCSVRAAEKKE